MKQDKYLGHSKGYCGLFSKARLYFFCFQCKPLSDNIFHKIVLSYLSALRKQNAGDISGVCGDGGVYEEKWKLQAGLNYKW